MDYRYRAVIFDLDGTLLDTLGDLTDAVNHTMREFGFPLRTEDEVRHSLGNGSDWLIARSLPEGTPDAVFRKAASEYRKYYEASPLEKTVPYRGMRELMERLSSDGILTAVVSNKMHATAVKLAMRFFPGAGYVTGEREKEGILRKPDPSMVLDAMERLGVRPEECVYAGDSEVDIETARRAGIGCISVLWGFRTEEELIKAGARITARDPDELLKLLSL